MLKTGDNLRSQIVRFPYYYEPIPKPFYVVKVRLETLGDRYWVVELDDDGNLVKRRQGSFVISWQARTYALQLAGGYKRGDIR